MSTIQFNPIPVVFNQEDHTYLNTETGAYLKGITSTLLHRTDPDKYKGVPKWKMDERAAYGTKIHTELELIESIGIEPITQEGMDYVRLKEEHQFEYLASEHTVSDLENYATNIDAIYTDKDGGLVIADYKTTSKFDRDYVIWQLSICAYFLEKNNPGLKVSRLVGIWLRPDTAQFIELPRRSKEEVKALIAADIADEPFEWEPMLPDYMEDDEQTLYTLGKQIQELTKQYDALKAEVLKKMIERNDKSVDSGRMLITVIAPSTRETFDSKKFKAEHEDLYANYIKTSKTKETLKLTIR